MDCDSLRDLVRLFVDGELDGDHVVTIKTHVSSCPQCATLVKVTRRLRIVVRERCGREPAPPHLRNRILSQLPHRRSGTDWEFD